MAKRPKVKPTPASAHPAPPPPRPSAAWPLVQTAGRAGVALGIVFGIMFAIVWVAGQTGRVVAPQERYTQKFDAIDCQAPPVMDKKQFLDEVRFRWQPDLPNELQVVDPNLRGHLAEVFARHEWVQAVESVEVKPNRTVRVGLKFRTPVLAVAVRGRTEPLVVDREAVILPQADPAPLAEFAAPPQPPPAQGPGQKWDSKVVRKAVDLAVNYKPKRIEYKDGWWHWVRHDGATGKSWWGE